MLLGDLGQLQIVVYGRWATSFMLLDVLHLVGARSMELIIAERDAGSVGLRGASRHIHSGMVIAQSLLIVHRRRTARGYRCAGVTAPLHGVAGTNSATAKTEPCQRWRSAGLSSHRATNDGIRLDGFDVVLHSSLGRFLSASMQRAVAGPVRRRVHGAIVEV
uniref:Putative secreted protein n=1 Tax=Anopheles marajoara TaxID=58244 RepID=A0A2M4C652_9DIPT